MKENQLMNLIHQLKTNTKLTYNEQVIAEYILKNLDAVLEMSIYILAQNTHTSTSAVVRLCKRCGTSGFREFKVGLSRDYAQGLNSLSEIDANMPFLPVDDPLMVSQKIAQLTKETITETQGLLSLKQLQRVTELLLNAKQIYGIGVSSNFIRLTDFQLKVLRIQHYVRLINLQAEQFYLAANSASEDAALMISASGKTAEIVNDAKHFRRNNTPIIAITADAESPLAIYATEVLQIPRKETSQHKVSDFSSQLAIEYVLNTLYACLFNHDFEHNFKILKSTPVSHF
ncbi:MAG: MurR/RpiR family transcriptional regulator [Schleiferilactobacillus perolens]